MFNTLKLAKNLINKANKSRKYRLLVVILAIKFLLSILTIIAISYFAVNAQNTRAAYGVNPKIKQVKTTDNSAVYYLDHARRFKKAYVNSKAFLAYGNKWSDIKVISDMELNKWPEVKLVKSKDNSAVYYIANGQKALIKSERQFIDSSFKWPDIVIISQADLAEYKTIDFKVADDTGNYSDSQLAIDIDPSSPKADYFIINTQDNLAAVFSLRALSQPVEIKKLVLDLPGVFNPDIIKEIYLANESDIEYPVFSSPNNRQVAFNFNSQPLIISPGQARKIKVYVNFNDSSSNIINYTFRVAINQAANLTGAKAVGDFPLAGEIFKLAAGGNFLEKAAANELSLNINNNQAIVGSTEKIIGKFNLAETSGQADIFVKELKLANQGNAAAPNLNNFKLKNKAGQIIAIAPVMTGDRELIFKLNDYKIKKAGNEIFTVLANVVSGENSTINFYLDKAKVMSSQGNFSLPVNLANLDEIIIIKRETLAVMAKELKPNNKVFTNQTGVIIGNFEIRNNNQKVSLTSLSFSLEKNSATPSLTETVYLVDYNSGRVYGYFNGDKFNNGAVSAGLSGLTLTAKQNLIIALVTKLPESAPNGGYYKIIFNSLDYRSDSGAFFSDAVDSAGTKLIISKSNLYLYPNNELGDQAFTKGEKNIKIASFIVEAAAGGDAKITDLTFSRGRDSSGVISFDNGFSNLRFYIGLTKIKEIKNPYSGDLAVGGFSYVLAAGSRTEIKIYADTEIDLKAAEIKLAISSLAAVNNNSFIPSAVNNLNVNSRKVSFGQASAEISKVAAGFVVKGEADNIIAGFKVKNTGAEDLRLQSITINAADQQLTYSLGYSDLRVVDQDQQRTAGHTVSRPVAGANKVDLGGFIIKAGQEAIFDVHIKTSAIITDKNINIYFSDFTAQGKNSGVNAIIKGDPTN